MSNYNPLGVRGMIRPSRPGRPERPSRNVTLTDYERELQPIYRAEEENEVSERNWMRPLQFVLDRLQTGQYISSNVSNIIAQAARGVPPEERQSLLEAVTTGLTGEVKGSYENVIRDTLGRGEGKVFGNAPEGTRRAQMDWADLLGFVGDVILDPLTYMSFGGATKGATKAAGEFADDSVRLYLRQLAQNPELILEKTGKNLTETQINGVLSRGTEYAQKWFRDNGGESLAKVMEDTYKTAYRQGLRQTQDQLIKSTREGIREIGEPEGGLAEWGLDSIAARMEAGSAYQHGGEVFGARVAGQELAKGPERGLTRIRRETWDRFANAFRESAPGKKAGDWVWSKMNNGPIGEIRKMLGFRNPYQKYLRAQELTQGKVMADVASNQALIDAFQPIKDFNDEELKQLRHVFSRREAAVAERVRGVVTTGTTPSDRLTGQLFTSGNPKVDEAAERLKGVLDKRHAEMSRMASSMGDQPIDYIEWYLPKVQRYRAGGPNPKMPRKRTYAESFEREMDLTKAIYGVDDDTARAIIETDATGLGVDIKEALAESSLVYGRTKARYNLMQQVRELGIDLRDSADPAANLLRTRGRDFNALGMKTIDNKMFDGFVFDADVADIAQRTIDITGKQKNYVMQKIAQYAQWWKGVVTSTTGFHGRNFMSNTMTQFLKHGGRAFNPKEIKASAVAVAFALDAANPKKFLDELGISEQWMRTYENMRFGNLTLRELAQEARRRGVISESTMGFSGQDVVQKIRRSSKRNAPVGQRVTDYAQNVMERGPVRDASRAIGNYIENIPRFQSFLIDYTDTASKNLGDVRSIDDLLKLDDPALNYASQEAKKWFLDYTDLTETEQKYMKNIIPFYSWLRKNLVNQISGVVLYPEMYSLIPKIEELVTYEDPDYDPAMVPEWMREEGMFPISASDREPGLIGKAMERFGLDTSTIEGGFRMFRPDFAYKDLNLIPLQFAEGDWRPHWAEGELKQDIINATAPWLKDIASRMTTENGYNFFYREELNETGDAPYLMRLLASRPGMITFIDGLFKMLGSEEGAKLSIDDDGKLQMDGQMAQTLEDYLPVLRQAEFLFYLPQTVVPGLEDIIERVSMAEDDYEGAEQAMQMLSYYLGVKVSDRDLDREKERLATDIYYRARDILSEQRSQAPGAEQRSLDYRQRTQESIRRLR